MAGIGGRIRLVHVMLLAWLLAFAAYTASVGLPTKRSNVVLWLVLAVLALGAASPRRTARALAFEWSPILLALAAYDLLRGASDPDPAAAHAWPHLHLDEWLGGGQSLAVRLQDLLWSGDGPSWFDYPVWAVYVSHFLVPLGIAVALWALRAHRFRPYLYGIALLSWMSLATYWLYPAQPPWMTATLPGNDDVVRVVHAMWNEVGIDRAARVWEPTVSPAASEVSATAAAAPAAEPHASPYANPVAALPSLHAAFPMFIFLMLRGLRRWLTVALALYVPAMAFALVYGGEHFVFDILLGWLYAAVAAWVVTRVWRLPTDRAAASADVHTRMPAARPLLAHQPDERREVRDLC